WKHPNEQASSIKSCLGGAYFHFNPSPSQVTDPLTRIIVPEMWLVLSLLLGTAVAQYPDMSSMISSSWSMWSPWSFCSNNVMVRVRACSTVKGFKCAGHNKEFQSCDSSKAHLTPSPTGIPVRATGEPPRALPDIDVLDPYSEDRRLAMRQLYEDYEVEVPDDEKTQICGRFPRPPSEDDEEVEFPPVDDFKPVTHNRPTILTTILTRPPVPWTTSSPAPPISSISTSTPITLTSIPTATTTTIQASTESPVVTTTASSGRSQVGNRIITEMKVMKKSRIAEKAKESDTAQRSASDSSSNASDVEVEDYDEAEDEEGESEPEQIPIEFTTTSSKPVTSTSATTTTSKIPSTTTMQTTSDLSASKTKAAVNLLPTSIFLGSPRIIEKAPGVSTSKFSRSGRKNKATTSKTSEWNNTLGQESRRRRLNKLNRRIRVKSIPSMPSKASNFTIEVTHKKSKAELQNEMDELQKQISEKKKQLAEVVKTSTTAAEVIRTTTTEAPIEKIEGDTARALSWMLATVEKMVNEKPSQPISDAVSVEKVDRDTEQELSRLPSGVEVISEQESFILKDDASSDPVIKVDKEKVDRVSRTSREHKNSSSAEWSDWSVCNCGVQSRKSLCLMGDASRQPVESLGYRQRQRRASEFCPPPEYETRPCHSDRCEQRL
uniref:ShKT domain-containing protein n=1 Tax=Haemonchus contortus TaxID=6289 RepID=A0A7I4YV71_HAECO